ncbi:MAG: acetate kinase [Flavobacteriales bacterium]|nr:acetate kinase [Flavobacteriales bacterium]
MLVINSGSSSIKYRYFELPSEAPICTGLLERIGSENAVLTHTVFTEGAGEKFREELPVPDHEAGLLRVVERLTDAEKGVIKSAAEVEVVGHRVVHGGEAFSETVEVTAAVKAEIKKLFALAPLHNAPNYLGIEVAEKLFPAARQVAVFDTAFHRTMPPEAYRAAVPKALYTDLGIRAYGFHGTSHRYVSRKAAVLLDNPDAKLITIHLGNGCSMAAVRGGKSVDNSMGLGPMGGLVMGTRSGDLDPSVIFHLLGQRDFSIEKVHEMLNKQSGLLGLCGHSDMRDLKAAAAAGDADAVLARKIYVYRIRKYIGSYAAVLNGADALIFTAGVGENDAELREEVCADMDFLGIHIDVNANRAPVSGPRPVHSVESKTAVWVIPTNEELEIALQCRALFEGEE